MGACHVCGIDTSSRKHNTRYCSDQCKRTAENARNKLRRATDPEFAAKQRAYHLKWRSENSDHVRKRGREYAARRMEEPAYRETVRTRGRQRNRLVALAYRAVKELGLLEELSNGES
jgi:hypothetical protein